MIPRSSAQLSTACLSLAPVVEDFYVKENNLVDWQWDSNQCNYISSGKPSWSVTLKGSDLESQKGKMCPF